MAQCIGRSLVNRKVAGLIPSGRMPGSQARFPAGDVEEATNLFLSRTDVSLPH